MNILIVDDEPVHLQTVGRGLVTRGHTVVKALNAQEALEHLNGDSEIDMVITDYAMPGITGIDLSKRIRKKYGPLPVMIMTGWGEKDLVVEALRHGCNSHIPKLSDYLV